MPSTSLCTSPHCACSLTRSRRNFTLPYVYPTTFAQPNLGLPLLYRSETEIKMFEEGLINATVVGVTI